MQIKTVVSTESNPNCESYHDKVINRLLADGWDLHGEMTVLGVEQDCIGSLGHKTGMRKLDITFVQVLTKKD